MWVWTSASFFSFLSLHYTTAQSQMCTEPFQAVITLINNETLPNPTRFLDSDLVFYRNVLRYTEEEIDRDTKAAMQFFRNTYGLDFTSIEPKWTGTENPGKCNNGTCYDSIELHIRF